MSPICIRRIRSLDSVLLPTPNHAPCEWDVYFLPSIIRYSTETEEDRGNVRERQAKMDSPQPRFRLSGKTYHMVRWDFASKDWLHGDGDEKCR